MIAYGNLTCYTGSNFLVWAAFAARFSRSPLPPLDLWNKEFAHLDSTTCKQAPPDEKTTSFLDRIVSDYGDSGVMEGVPVCFFIENVSITMSLLLTDPRHGWSPIERSTRRQLMKPVSKKTVPRSASEYSAWDAYNDAYEITTAELRKQHASWSAMEIRDAACDAVRDAVPLDACSAIAITANVRSLCNLYHNLRPERFTNLDVEHAVFHEIEHLRADIAAMVLARYAPFSRKFDNNHDTFIEDPSAAYVFSAFIPVLENNSCKHQCMALSVTQHKWHSLLLPTTCAEKNVVYHRENRHGDIPTLYHNVNLLGELYSTVSVLREFKRHRTIACYDIHIDKGKGHPTLGNRAFWRFTCSLGDFMRMTELRTEEKAHVDIQALVRDILKKLSSKYDNFAALHDHFFFTEVKS